MPKPVRVGLIFMLAALVVFVILMPLAFGVRDLLDLDTNLGGPEGNIPWGETDPVWSRVTYTVDGARKADITFRNESAITIRFDGEELPWSFTFQASAGDRLSVSAQNRGRGRITCAIQVNGVTVERNGSTGKDAICTVSWHLAWPGP